MEIISTKTSTATERGKEIFSQSKFKIPQTLPPLDLPPPDTKETIETYRPPDEALYCKPLPVLKDAEELDVFTRHIPKQADIDKFLQILKAKVTKSYDLSVTASELVKEYPHSPACSVVFTTTLHKMFCLKIKDHKEW